MSTRTLVIKTKPILVAAIGHFNDLSTQGVVAINHTDRDDLIAINVLTRALLDETLEVDGDANGRAAVNEFLEAMQEELVKIIKRQLEKNGGAK